MSRWTLTPARARSRQGIGESSADLARPVDVGLEGDAAPSSTNGFEHRREDLIAVVERRDPIAGHEGGTEQATDGIERTGDHRRRKVGQLSCSIFSHQYSG